MRLLDGARIRVDVAEAMELAVVGDAVLGPETDDDVEPFLEAGAAVLHGHAEHVELLREARPERRKEVEAELHAPAPRRPAARTGVVGGERGLEIRESR